jgi:hypothetical protein
LDTALAGDATEVRDLDSSAREVFADLSALESESSAALYCEYQAYRTSCAAVFPECPENEHCRKECAMYNDCGAYYVKKNSTQYTFTDADCGKLCQDSGVEGMLAVPVVLSAFSLLVASLS